MRFFFPTACAALLLFPFVAGADDDKFAKQLLEKSLKSLGPIEKLEATPAVICQCTATVFENGKPEGGLSGTWTIGAADLLRAELQMQRDNRTESATLVINGKKAWIRDSGRNKTEEAPAEVAPVIKGIFRMMHLSRNPHLLRAKGLELSHLGELKIKQRDTVGLRIKQKDQQDMDVYFDKKTHLPHQSVVVIKSPGGGDQEVELRFTLDDYKMIGGRKHFTKLIVDAAGKKVMEMKLSKVELKGKLDKSLFGKP